MAKSGYELLKDLRSEKTRGADFREAPLHCFDNVIDMDFLEIEESERVNKIRKIADYLNTEIQSLIEKLGTEEKTSEKVDLFLMLVRCERLLIRIINNLEGV